MIKLKVISVNISEKKGTVKFPVKDIFLDANGVNGDAHSGPWHRQVSLLGVESFNKFEKSSGKKLEFGDFAENITTQGLELHKTHPLDRFTSGDIELEVTQIGKKCHGDNCAIFKEVGNCIMPLEGIFCRVVKPGIMKKGDEMTYLPRIFKANVITLSDRASAGIYEDKSGPRVLELLNDHFVKTNRQSDFSIKVIPDNESDLKAILNSFKNSEIDFLFTTGGTGIGPRDITVDVVKPLLDKEIPGIMEMIRMKYGAEKPNALLSRGVAGVMGKTLVFTLPGSVKAVNEYMTEILKVLDHLVLMLHGIDAH